MSVSNLPTVVTQYYLKRNSTPGQRNWMNKLIWHLFLVLNNIPKYNKSQSNYFLTTPTYIHTDGNADPFADWAMISNRPGNNQKGEAAPHYLQLNQVLFSQVYLILFSAHPFLLPPGVVGSVVT